MPYSIDEADPNYYSARITAPNGTTVLIELRCRKTFGSFACPRWVFAGACVLILKFVRQHFQNEDIENAYWAARRFEGSA